MTKYFLLLCILSIILLSCDKQKNRESEEIITTDIHVSFEKLDSIQIYYLGEPTVHDLDPVSKRVIFMENNIHSVGEEIFVADFKGNILASFIKDGDTRDTYGRLLASLVIDDENSILAYAYNGFMRYDFDGNLISQVKIVDFQGFSSTVIGMGAGLQKLGEGYIYRSISYKFDFESKDFFDGYHAMSLLDPETGRREPIIALPETSIFRQGNFFFSGAWESEFYVESDLLYLVFGLEPVIYVYENQAPFSLITSIPMELPDYRYFKGEAQYKRDDVRFYGHRISSGKIHNIKKLEGYFLIAYFPGYDIGDTEESFSSNKSPDFWNRMREKYPTRIAILDSTGRLVNDFVPEGLFATSMLIRNGELWVMEKPDQKEEQDYFRLFRMGLKVGE